MQVITERKVNIVPENITRKSNFGEIATGCTVLDAAVTGTAVEVKITVKGSVNKFPFNSNSEVPTNGTSCEANKGSGLEVEVLSNGLFSKASVIVNDSPGTNNARRDKDVNEKSSTSKLSIIVFLA